MKHYFKLHNIRNPKNICNEDQKRRLAQAYALILSWPELPNKETTGSDDFGETTEPVEETPTENADVL